MHPTCRQVPPRKGSFSTTTVFSPNSPARIAATYPPGPLPIIAHRTLPRAISLPQKPVPITRLGNRIAVTPVSRSKKLDGSGQKGGAPVARYANAVPKRTKSRPRLRRRRLRPSKQEILTAVRPPRNLLARSLLRPPLSVFSRLSNANSLSGEDKENSRRPQMAGCVASSCHCGTSKVLVIYLR